jgi:hypothetical protein
VEQMQRSGIELTTITTQQHVNNSKRAKIEQRTSNNNNVTTINPTGT